VIDAFSPRALPGIAHSISSHDSQVSTVIFATRSRKREHDL
jgi:hypothetical protein